MSEPTELPDADFDTQLRGLFQEAEQKIQGRIASVGTIHSSKSETEARGAEDRALRAYATLPQMLRPMVLGLEALSRATGENATVLQRLDRALTDATEAQGALPRLVSGLESLLEQKNGVNQRMFDALHEELKSYKDGFLMESVLRPIVRDLISLFDDLSMIHAQMQECVRVVGEVDQGSLSERLRTMNMNIEHHCEFVLEILERLEVILLPIGIGKLDKQTQRAVSIELTGVQEQDMTVVRTVKRGFLWKERVLRAEEVVMRRWKAGAPILPAR